jgi:dephospho-CoA kinase
MFPGSSIPVLGLTGPSGAGKTTAAAYLAGRGCFVIDCDALARELTEPGAPLLEELARGFGEDILYCGALNRALLAQRAFASEAKRQTLNRITHPAIAAQAIARAGNAPKGTPAMVLDAAALPESELLRFCDHFVLMQAPQALRLRRTMARDGITKLAAQRRMAAQKSIQYLPPPGMGYTIVKSDESEAVWQHALDQILGGF